MSSSLHKRLKTDLTEIFWSIIVSHWQQHVHLTIADLQLCYEKKVDDREHFLNISYMARIENTPVVEAVRLAKVNMDALIQQIANLMYTNICLLHAENLSAVDMMLRRSMLKMMLKDKIAYILLPPYDFKAFTSATNKVKTAATSSPANQTAAPTAVQIAEKPKKNHEDKEKERAKGSRKDIVKSIEAEVALEEDQKKRFNSDEYAELRDMLNIS